METNKFNQQQTNTPQQSGLGIAGMIIGIISLLLACFVVGGFFGVIGLILSIVALTQKDRKSGMAIAGIVLNAIAIVIMVLMFIVSLDSGDEVKNVATGSTVEQTIVPESTPETNAQEAVFHQGETAEYRNVQVTLYDVKESSGSQYNTPSDGNVFVLAGFEIANNSDDELAISSLLSFSAYQDGYATNLSLTALIESDGEQLDGSIAPGKKMKGYIGYEIPNTYEELEIHVQPSVWSDKKIVFIHER